MSDINPYAAPQSEIVEPVLNDSPIPGPHNYATRSQRFLGSLIDTIILLVPVFALFFAAAGGAAAFFSDEVTEPDGIFAILLEESFLSEIVSTVIILVVMVVIQGYFWHTRSQSIGKIVMKTKIVTLDGQPANFNNIVFRRTLIIQLLIMIPGIGNLVSIIDGLMIFRQEHNCLHDDIAGTRVVRITPPTDS